MPGDISKFKMLAFAEGGLMPCTVFPSRSTKSALVTSNGTVTVTESVLPSVSLPANAQQNQSQDAWQQFFLNNISNDPDNMGICSNLNQSK